MKLLKPTLLLATLLFAIQSAAPRLRADDVTDHLRADYQGKVLTLRQFYQGHHLVFRDDGSLTGSAEVGLWTVDGEIFFQTVAVRGRTLRIRGRRVSLVFDSKKGPPRDVLEWLAESKLEDRNKRAGDFRARDVDIDIHLDTKDPDAEGAKAAINAVFLTHGESMRDIVPDFCREYFDQVEGHPRKSTNSVGVFVPRKGEVSPPHGTYMPNPSFSDEARIAKYQGTMTLSVVVDPSGAASDVAIVTPLGLGLDEKAVEQVRSWKFDPGMRNGSPVPVKVMVEVDFHLY